MKRNAEGFSVAEMLVAMVIALFALLAVLSAYTQANSIKTHVQGTIRIQGNVRLAMDRLSREMRMTGFAVPHGWEMGATASWNPPIFHAENDEVGFRADVDGGKAEITCTPDSTNANCLLNKLRLDSLDYYQNLNCNNPDGSLGGLKLIADMEGVWKPFTCTGFSVSDDSISVASVPDAAFEAGLAHVATVEQIYYRYLPSAQPPYGRLLRHVRYDNTPDNTFPPTGVTWVPVADHLTDFWMEYQDGSGTAITGSPMTVAQRAAIRRVAIFMEGYDKAGPDDPPQVIQVRSEVLVRNRRG